MPNKWLKIIYCVFYGPKLFVYFTGQGVYVFKASQIIWKFLSLETFSLHISYPFFPLSSNWSSLHNANKLKSSIESQSTKMEIFLVYVHVYRHVYSFMVLKLVFRLGNVSKWIRFVGECGLKSSHTIHFLNSKNVHDILTWLNLINVFFSDDGNFIGMSPELYVECGLYIDGILFGLPTRTR
jgi:hypothetical protein